MLHQSYLRAILNSMQFRDTEDRSWKRFGFEIKNGNLKVRERRISAIGRVRDELWGRLNVKRTKEREREGEGEEKDGGERRERERKN